MARYTSGDQKDLRVGISSFSEDKTSLEVIGRVGLGTDDAVTQLHVEGDSYFQGNVGIGTTIPTDSAKSSNTTILSVGILTAAQIFGTITGTVVGVASEAVAIQGGGAGQLLYQESSGVTTFLSNGNIGEVLVSKGAGLEPEWQATAPAGAVEGITVFDEGSLVGTAGSITRLDFRGSSVTVTGTSGAGGIATITTTPTFDEGINVTSGITTLGVVTATSLTVDSLNVTGVVTATSFVGDGSNLTGITTLIVAGANVTVTTSNGISTISSSAGGGSGTGFFEQNNTGIHTLSNVGVGTTTANGSHDPNNTAILNAGIVTAKEYYGEKLSVGIITGVQTIGVQTLFVGVISATTIQGTISTSSIPIGAGSFWVSNDTGIHTLGGVGIGTTTVDGAADSNNTTVLNVGVVTAVRYYGDGSNLTGLDDGVGGLWEETSVGINTLSSVGIGTTNPVSDLQVGSGTSSFNVVSTGSSVLIGIGTTNPQSTLDVVGEVTIEGDITIDGSLTQSGNTIPSIGVVIALSGY